ncbi:MAG: tetratricopeptide repeat protein [Planctomycetaceae bacterium]|nr:tetratricopeptide repeat protein [Planctomycetaceae bacterium]
MTLKKQTMLVLLLAAGMLTGCSLPDKLKISSFKKSSGNKALSKLNNPEKFTLSYAKWQEQQGQLQEAQESYRIVLSENRANREAKLGLARVNTRLGNYSEAETALKELLKGTPTDAEVLDAVAQLYAEKGDWTRALSMLDRAVASEPNNETYRYHHAVALAEFGKIPESLDEFRRVLPDSEANFNLAVVLKRRGELRGAEYYAAQALMLDPRYPEAKKLYQELRSEQTSRYAARSENYRTQATQPAGYQVPVSPANQGTPGTIEYYEESRPPFEQ